MVAPRKELVYTGGFALAPIALWLPGAENQDPCKPLKPQALQAGLHSPKAEAHVPPRFALRLLPGNLRAARPAPTPKCEQRVWAQAQNSLPFSSVVMQPPKSEHFYSCFYKACKTLKPSTGEFCAATHSASSIQQDQGSATTHAAFRSLSGYRFGV